MNIHTGHAYAQQLLGNVQVFCSFNPSPESTVYQKCCAVCDDDDVQTLPTLQSVQVF